MSQFYSRSCTHLTHSPLDVFTYTLVPFESGHSSAVESQCGVTTAINRLQKDAHAQNDVMIVRPRCLCRRNHRPRAPAARRLASAAVSLV